MYFTVQYSAPGSLILLGEHAVLHGKKCIACAIYNRVSIAIKPLETKKIRIFSNIGKYTINLNDLNKIIDVGIQKETQTSSKFFNILLAIKSYKLNCGLEISIKSNLPPSKGLGSSGAVIVAFLACLQELKKGHSVKEQDFNEIFLQGYKIINNNKNIASGYDLATALYGGMVLYSISDTNIDKTNYYFEKIDIKNPILLSAFYCGYKTHTEKVLEKIKPLELKYKNIYKNIYHTIDNIVDLSLPAIRKEDWITLGELMNLNNGFLEAIGVSDSNLSSMVYNLRNVGALGAKISGAGLGDCVIALENTGSNLTLKDFEKISLEMSDVGLKKIEV